MTVEPRRLTGVMTGLLIVALLCVGLSIWWARSSATLAQAEEAIIRKSYAEAERLAASVAAKSKLPGVARLVAARAARSDSRPTDSLFHLMQVPPEDPNAVFCRLAAAELCLSPLGRLTECERALRDAERLAPQDRRVRERLAFLLGLCGRSTEAEPYRIGLLVEGVEPATLLWLLCLGDDAIENTELLSGLEPSSNDPLVLLALGRFVGDRKDAKAGRTLLERSLNISPGLVEARVRLGRHYLDVGLDDELAGLLRESTDVEWHPGLWSLRGGWCQHHGQTRAAVRCYLEALRRSPNHARACYPLAQLFESLGHSDLAATFRARAERLAEYLNAVKAVRQEFTLDRWSHAAMTARELGLVIEASGWLAVARPEWRQTDTARDLDEWRRAQDSARLARTPRALNPAEALDLDKWPRPDFSSSSKGERSVPSPQNVGTIKWDNVATTAGFDFVYQPTPGSTRAGPRMFEFTGGGVGVLDYDLDGWPDVWMTQGRAWPAGQPISPETRPIEETSDNLFRNELGDRFTEVSHQAGIEEWGFGQGITVFDANADGFSDVVVANIGRNQLWINSGDGTFRDGGPLPGESAWNTSLGAADFTGDGLPDLYCVRYLGGDDIFTKTCPDTEGHPHSCLPQSFPAAADQVLVNQGDGTFADATSQAGLVDTTGKGLGIVIGRMGEESSLAIFVANDTTPNFCWTWKPQREAPHFADQALLNGLALNGEGRAQADMGVAADDIDEDGRLDLFVTKFFNETNTLYRQTQPGQFLDATAGSGLGESSLRLLGFGTQFLDADLDGRPDLLITNGHIDDARHRGEAFAMRPQFYRNEGQNRFVEQFAPTLGPFFSTEHLGRGLARLDWNRDGREDAVISHIGTPASLVENRTTSHGHFLSLSLVGRLSPREPIGAVVTAQCGSRILTKHLTAGDGYHASNQRTLHFGLGEATRVDRLTVEWPSGAVCRVDHIAADSEWLWVEGAAAPFQRP